LLVTVPIEAVMTTGPSAPVLPVAVTTPSATVAIFVALEFHVAISRTFTSPLHVLAVAEVKENVVAGLAMLPLDGAIVIELTQATVTVSDCVPLMDGRILDVAVTVAVPVSTEVTKPAELMVATPVAGLMLHVTGVLPELPSLNVPTANICTVLSVVPVSMVGLAGPTEMELRVGFTKNPLQLASKAKVASAARAPIKRSCDFVEDIFFQAPWARPGSSAIRLYG
jgi:hypothetical protein